MIKLRRPLCAAGLAYAAAAVVVVCTAGDAPLSGVHDRERTIVAGFVEQRETRLSRSGESTVITLSDAVILENDQIANLERFLSDSEKIPQYRLHNIWKQNRENLRKEDTTGIEGVLCYMEEREIPETGSLVLMSGTYRAFARATNPGEFDSAAYYRITGQQGRIMECRLLAKSKSHNGFREGLCRMREYLSLLLDACYDGKNASVMKAMLLGEKGTLDADLKELYRQSGIIHILAISGLHLSVIGMGVHKLFGKMRIPKAVNIILTTGFMYCYGTMTGMGISMLRAYIMFVLRLGAELAGRTYDLMTAAAVAVLVVLGGQPLYLQHSGFLFSFGAVCGIGTFLPAVKTNLFGHTKAEEVLFSGIAVSLATLPVYLCFYYEFPPYSVLLNLFVIPGMTFVLLGGLASLGGAALFLPLGRMAAVPVQFVLGLYEKCCNGVTHLPDSRWITGCPGLWQAALFVGILVLLGAGNRRLPKLFFWQGVLCALLVLTIRLPEGLQITMVDVGQGDCIYLQEESGVHMLIDGGSSDRSEVAAYQIIPFLKYEGVSRLDAVVVTHPDDDHISGIRTMLEDAGGDGIFVETLYLPDVGEAGRNRAYLELEDLAEAAGIPVRYIGTGDRLHFGKVMLTCMNPEKGWNTADTNAYSTVLYLTYGTFSALFTGDLEGGGERRVTELLGTRHPGAERDAPAQSFFGRKDAIQAGTSGITLLKTAHHGSGNSTGDLFLRQTAPAIALISSGRGNRYGHPHKELLERLEQYGCIIYGTQQSGAVTVRVKGRGVKVEAFLKE